MNRTLLLSVVASTMIMAGGNIAPVEPVETTSVVPEASNEFSLFSDIYGKGELRPRYEFVSTDNTVGDAKGLTNRLMLGVGANLFNIDGLSTYMEATNVSGSGDYWDLSNSDINDKEVYNVIADPSQTRITQAYIDYKAGETLLRVGRQGVNLDNKRFIGTVDWRQMPQTYDAVAVIDKSMNKLSLLGAYVWRVNTIFNSDSIKPVKDSFDTGSVLLHASYNMMPSLKITGYGYLIEDIHDTYGIAATGKIGFSENMTLSYRAEYAMQTDPSLEDTTTNKTADADYYNLTGTLNASGILFGGGYEVLSAGNGKNASFSTPLATLHAHNGWNDKFLGTPEDGLVDASVILGYKSKSFGIAKIIYHDFSSDTNNINYGTEIDLLYKRAIPGIKGLTGLIKAGLYSADEFSINTDKYWVMLDYKF